ncbi:MAG: hypothetical protein E7455_05060 [Ruminococcaceae bacterium]|nr:hypothetical protein [Oscillospiraceae bacterium]
MAGKIIGWVVAFGCAILFYGIGVYAQKLEKPMWFWSGTEVDATKITDVAQYNAENATMWKWYSLWYVAAGVAQIWSSIAYAIILVLSCTVGLAILIRKYQRILKKYSIQ